MYRTADGGRTWQRVRLPPVRGHEFTAAEQPDVFGGGGVVVIARLRSACGTRRTASYERGRRRELAYAPRARAGKGARGSFAGNGSDWFAPPGTTLSATTNAGSAWDEVTAHTPSGDSINTIEYLSPTVGWAQAAGPTVGDLYPTFLLRTANGRRSWSRSTSNPEPPECSLSGDSTQRGVAGKPPEARSLLRRRLRWSLTNWIRSAPCRA